MGIFRAEPSFARFGGSAKKVDLMINVASLREQHSGAMVLKGPLATDSDIDDAIEALKRELESLRDDAKRKLKS